MAVEGSLYNLFKIVIAMLVTLAILKLRWGPNLFILFSISSLHKLILQAVGHFMNSLYWLSDDQIVRLQLYFSESQCIFRVNERVIKRYNKYIS